MSGEHITDGFVENPDGSVRFPTGKTLTKEEIEAQKAKERADTRPALKKDLARDRDALLQAIASVLKKERRITRDEIAEAVKDLSGLETLRGAARLICDGNAECISRALEPALNRKAVVIEGEPPAWLQRMFH